MLMRHTLTLVALLFASSCSGPDRDRVARAAESGATELVLGAGWGMDSFDPAIAYSFGSWQMFNATCAKLVTYRDVENDTDVVAELAVELPEISPDRLAYTFTVRDDVRFAAPPGEEGELITAATVLRSFERTRSVVPPWGGESPAASYTAGVVAELLDGNRIRFTLPEPAGDFLHRLAMMFFCVVPMDYPLELQSAPPTGAGPYTFESVADPDFDEEGNPLGEGSIVLVRNPSYAGPRPAGFDRIRYRTYAHVGPPDVVAGEIDHVIDGVDPRDPLVAGVGPDGDGVRLLSNPLNGYYYLTINTARVPTAIRQAINFAIDRPSLSEFGAWRPDGEYLPDTMGYAPTGLYPAQGSDLERARELVRSLGPAHRPLVLWARKGPFTQSKNWNRLIHQLGAAGIAVRTELMSYEEYDERLYGGDTSYDLLVGGWIVDYPDPASLVVPLMKGDGFFNFSAYSGHDAEIAAANQLSGPDRHQAFAALVPGLMAAAPIAVIGNPQSFDFFSSRVGCAIFSQGTSSISLPALCPR